MLGFGLSITQPALGPESEIAGIATDNLFPKPKCVDGDGWSDNGGTTTALTDNALGYFPGASVQSDGQKWHRLNAVTEPSVSLGTSYFLKVFWKAGTSGELRIVLRDETSGNESQIRGAYGSLSNALSFAGAITNISESVVSGVNIFTGTYTPSGSFNVIFGIGPGSSTSGETVIAYGAIIREA